MLKTKFEIQVGLLYSIKLFVGQSILESMVFEHPLFVYNIVLAFTGEISCCHFV